MNKPAFDFSPVLVECQVYIDTVTEFDVRLLGGIKVQGNTTTQRFDSINVKEHLIEFVFKCEEEALNGKLSLINYVKVFRADWSISQSENIAYIDKEIHASSIFLNTKRSEARKVGALYYDVESLKRISNLKTQRENCLLFYLHNSNLISIVQCRVMGFPLPEHLEVGRKQLYSDIDSIEESNEKLDLKELSTDPSKDLLTPVLYINPTSKQKLYDDLCKYVDPREHTALNDLILKNITPENNILIDCQVKEFGLTFVTANAVRNDGAQLLSEQIPKYFVYNKKGKKEPFKSSSLVKHLRGKG